MNDSWLIKLLFVGLVLGNFQAFSFQEDPKIAITVDGIQKKAAKGTQAVLVRPGQTVVLNCSFACSETVVEKCSPLRWVKKSRKEVEKGVEVKANSRHRKEVDDVLRVYSDFSFTSSFSNYEMYVCSTPFGFQSTAFIDVIEVEGAENVTLPTKTMKESVGKSIYPKIVVNDSQALELKCEFNSTVPQAIRNVLWRHNNVLLQKTANIEMMAVTRGRYHSAVLRIVKPTAKSVGEYRCEVSVAVAETYNKIINVYGPPITTLEKQHSLRVAEGAKLQLTCAYTAHPNKDVKIEWFRTNYTLPFTDRGINVMVEDEMKNDKVVAKKNVLTFNDMKETDKGAYFCKVTTAFGSDYIGWHVRVKNRLAFLWPLVGIILELIIVVVIIVIYEIKRNKRRKAKAQAAADRQFTDEDCQGPAMDYDADSEVRQRLARA